MYHLYPSPMVQSVPLGTGTSGTQSKAAKNMTKFVTALLLSLLPIYSLGEAADLSQLVKPSAPEIAYGGRWEKTSKQLYRVGRGAAYLEANFVGDTIGAKIDDKGQEIFWLAQIDNGKLQRFQAKKDTTVLGTKLGSGNHKLLLARDSEGSAGVTDFAGLILDKSSKLLPPPATPKYKLEFLGDSITAGAYALGDGMADNASYMTVESSYLAFGPELARQLGAEYSVIASSGEGIVHSYMEREYAIGNHAIDNYKRTFFSEYLPQWQETGREPDVIILNHGTNDYIGSPFPRPEYFEAGYRYMIETIRKMHPSSIILCVSPVPVAEYQITDPIIAHAVQAEQNKGDKRVYYIPLNSERPLLQSSDFAGDNTHPLAKGHAKIADFLYPIVANFLKQKS
jgi:lysophospholipase L1-like esterase